MNYEAVLVDLDENNYTATLGFYPRDWKLASNRWKYYKEKEKHVSASIQEFIPYKTTSQLGLFRTCCRKIACTTNMDEEDIVTAIKEGYGVWKKNPLYINPSLDSTDESNPKLIYAKQVHKPEILESIANYNEKQMDKLIQGVFAEGEYLRLHGGYDKLNLWDEYEEYVIMRAVLVTDKKL